MQEYKSSRSRLLAYQRCPRSRWELHERAGTGYEPIRQSIPLATGAHTHTGLADLLRGNSLEQVVSGVLAEYDETCRTRGLAVKDLEDSSRVYAEQRALTEGLLRMAALRTIPRLLETYEVLEVERMDQVILWEQLRRIVWRSIPDALLRERSSGDLYLLSWKTPAELPRDAAARIDMQGLSEVWAIETRWRQEEQANPPARHVRGVQMAYLLKGRKIDAKQETAGDAPAAGKFWRHNNPLIWGYVRDTGGLGRPEYAFSRTWQCSQPHPMRKSQWYPSGECPGDGRNHMRGQDWRSFAVWEAMGVKEWIAMLAEGAITPEAGDPLEQGWALPVPNYRQRGDVERWARQAAAQERQIAANLAFVRQYEDALVSADDEDEDRLLALEACLDETFPQHTERWCLETYGGKCPAYELCFGPDETRRNPLSSGLYQVKTQYEPKAAE